MAAWQRAGPPLAVPGQQEMLQRMRYVGVAARGATIMSKQDKRPRRRRKRKTTATVGGISQSAFANRTMADLQQPKRRSDGQKNAVEEDDDKPDTAS